MAQICRCDAFRTVRRIATLRKTPRTLAILVGSKTSPDGAGTGPIVSLLRGASDSSAAAEHELARDRLAGRDGDLLFHHGVAKGRRDLIGARRHVAGPLRVSRPAIDILSIRAGDTPRYGARVRRPSRILGVEHQPTDRQGDDHLLD